MAEISVVTDSIACLPRELVDKYGIEIIPITMLVDGNVYRDWVDITPTEAYKLFLKEPTSFKTAPATPETCLAVFRKISRKTDRIVFISVSSKISTVLNMVQVAKERAVQELPHLRIELIDSETATAAQGFVVLAAARAACSGKSLSEVIDSANRVRSKVKAIVVLDTIKYVYRSGRVPWIAARAASMLNIHPIFTISGTIHYAAAATTKRNAIERMFKMMEERVNNSPVHCAVMHAYDQQGAKSIKRELASRFDCVELWLSEFSPVMGYATGTGTLGVAFYSENSHPAGLQ